jgi:hypothetical protein
VHAAPARIWTRLGWRGLTLALSGISWITYGISITTQPRYGTVRGISVLLGLLPMTGWGWVWIGTGLVSLAFAAATPGHDSVGVAAAMAPPLLWSLAYAMGGATFSQAWGSVLPWGSHAAMIAIIVYLTRPRMIVMVPHGDH